MTRRQKILIVDDRKSNLVALERTLQEVEADIIAANSGNEALSATLNHDFALAILDVMMPEMDGYELAQHLQDDQKTKSIPIIFLTASNVDEESAFKGYEAGGIDYIVKPYSPGILLGKVKNFLELDRYRSQLEDLIHDRTIELMEANRALRQSTRLLNEIQQVTKIGGWEIDVKNQLIYCTVETCNIHGFEPGIQVFGARDFLDQTLECYLPHDRSDYETAFSRCMMEGVPYNLELPFVSRKDERLWIRTSAQPFWENGEIIRVIGSIMDITKNKLMEAQLYQSQKMESIGQLAGGVAHDFNNLLTIIMGNCELASQVLDEDDPMAEMIREISQSSLRAAGLTRQLLAFSRRQVMEPKILDVNGLVLNLEKMLKRLIGEDIDYKTVLSPDMLHIKADPGQLEQVIVNLVVNSRDAMPNGGKLTIETECLNLDENYAHTHYDTSTSNYIMIAVSDTGFGMDEKTRDKVFDPFFTTKEVGKGTGLGLSTVYGIIKQSGGHIVCYSEPRKGTTFKIYLPVSSEEQVVSPASVFSSFTPRSGSATLLVAEDNDSVRELIAKVARKAGYQVMEAEDGKKALAECKDYAEAIDLLITDVVMPGMNGKTLSLQAGKIKPEMKTLFISGYTDNAIVHQGVLEANAYFLQKPFTPDRLLLKIHEVLNS